LFVPSALEASRESSKGFYLNVMLGGLLTSVTHFLLG